MSYRARQAPLKRWAFLTHHAQVLLAVARDPSISVSEIAASISITERYVYRLLSDLQQAGYIRRSRKGRRNRYELSPELELGDPGIEELPLRQLLTLTATAKFPKLAGWPLRRHSLSPCSPARAVYRPGPAMRSR